MISSRLIWPGDVIQNLAKSRSTSGANNVISPKSIWPPDNPFTRGIALTNINSLASGKYDCILKGVITKQK